MSLAPPPPPRSLPFPPTHNTVPVVAMPPPFFHVLPQAACKRPLGCGAQHTSLRHMRPPFPRPILRHMRP
eukprot:229430-Chlamydomonas_euryale.AAC.1